MSSKLYVLTLVAARPEVQDTGIQFEPNGTTIFTVQSTEEAAEQIGLQNVHRTYPTADGWIAHTVHVHEMPPTSTVEGYEITWDLRENVT